MTLFKITKDRTRLQLLSQEHWNQTLRGAVATLLGDFGCFRGKWTKVIKKGYNIASTLSKYPIVQANASSTPMYAASLQVAHRRAISAQQKQYQSSIHHIEILQDTCIETNVTEQMNVERYATKSSSSQIQISRFLPHPSHFHNHVGNRAQCPQCNQAPSDLAAQYPFVQWHDDQE